jgi:competence protein ComEA
MTRTCGALLMAFMIVTPLAAVQEPSRPSAPKAAAAAPVVNLNTATAAQLTELPGIGARTAERIIEYRQKNGGFKKIEELMNVRGVGEKSFLKLKALITVTPPKTERVVQA